jgi:hypothetical protein
VLFNNSFILFNQENLVVNPNCELFSNCPDNYGQIDRCIGWWDYDNYGSPDYLNKCAPTTSNVYIPNGLGYQFPLSDNGMIHSIVLVSENPQQYLYNQPPFGIIQIRESFGGTFIRPLKPVIHFVEFYVNFSNYGWSDGFGGGEGRVATNAFDLLLLKNDDPINNSVSPYIDLNDVIKVNKENSVLNDTVNWVKVSTCFIPKGGETNFAIGAFRDTNDISLEFSGTSLTNRYLASYYFDNFNVYECPTCCPDQFPPEQHVYVFSSPSAQNNATSMQVWLSPNTTGELKIFDSAGRLVAHKSYAELENNFVFENFAAGIYHFTLSTSDGVLENGKVMVSEF